MAVTKSGLVVDIEVNNKGAEKDIKVVTTGLKELKDAEKNAGKASNDLAKDLSNIGTSSTVAANSIEKINDSFNGIENKAQKAGGSFESFSFGVLKVYAAVQLAEQAFHALKGVFDSTIGAYAEAEDATKRLGQTLKAVGEKDIKGATDRFKALSEAIEIQTGADADQIISMIQRGKATGITNDNMEIMVALASKMSAAFGGSIQDNFDTLYESTIGMGRGIGRLGADLKALTPEALIAGEGINILQNKLKDFDANTGTLNQTMAKIKTQFGNLAEATGKFLLEGLRIDVLLQGLVSVLTSATAFMTKFNDAINEADLSMKDLAIALGPIAVSFGIIFSSSVLKSVTSLIGLVRSLSAGFLLLSLKVIAVSVSILAVLVIVETLTRNFDKLGQVGLVAFDYIKLGIAKLTGNDGEVTRLGKEIDDLKKGLDFGVTGQAIGKVSDIFKKLTGDTNGATKSTGELGDAIAGMNGRYKAAKIGLSAEEIKKELDRAAQEVEKYQKFIDGLTDRSAAVPVSKNEGVMQQKLRDQRDLNEMIEKTNREAFKSAKAQKLVEEEILKAKQAIVRASVAGLQKNDTEAQKELLELGGKLTREVLNKTEADKNERNEVLTLLDEQILRNDIIINQMADQLQIEGLAASGDKRLDGLYDISQALKDNKNEMADEFDLMVRANDVLRKKKEYTSDYTDLKIAKDLKADTLEIEKAILEIEKNTRSIDTDNTKIQNYTAENKVALEIIDKKYKLIKANIDLESAEKEAAQQSTKYYEEKLAGIDAEIKRITDKGNTLLAEGKISKEIAEASIADSTKASIAQKKLTEEKIADINAVNKQKTATMLNLEAQLAATDKQIEAQNRLKQAQIDSTPKEFADWIDAIDASLKKAFNKNHIAEFFTSMKTDIGKMSGTVIDIVLNRKTNEDGSKASPDNAMQKAANTVVDIAGPVVDAIGTFGEVAGNTIGAVASGLSSVGGWMMAAIDFVLNLPAILQKLLDVPAALMGVMDAIPSIMDKIIQNFPRLINSLADKIPGFLAAVVSRLPELIQSFLDALPTIVERIYEMIPEVIIRLIGMIPKIFIMVVKSMFQIFQSMVKGLIRGISNVLQGKKHKDANVIDTADKAVPKEALAKLSGQTDRLFSVKDLSDKAASGIEKIQNTIEQSNEKADKKKLSVWQEMGKVLTAMWTGAGMAITKVWQDIWGAIGRFTEWIKEGWAKAGEWFSAAGGWLKTAWDKSASYLKDVWDKARDIGENINTVFNKAVADSGRELSKFGVDVNVAVLKAADDFWVALMKGVGDIGREFGNFGTMIWEGLKSGLDGLGKIFQDLFDGLNVTNLMGKVFNFDGPEAKGKGTVEKALNIDIPYLSFAEGGVVPGKAKVRGDNLINDNVIAMLSPGEVVIPRSLMDNPRVRQIIEDVLNGDLNPPNHAKGKKKKSAWGNVVSTVNKAVSDTGKAIEVAGGQASNVGQSALDTLSNLDPTKKMWQLVDDKIGEMMMKVFESNKFANGGPVGTDTVPAMLSPGEFIMSRKGVSESGVNRLRQMNAGLSSNDGPTTNNITIEVNIDAKLALDKTYIQEKLIPEIKSSLKRASLNGEFILSEKGLRA